MNIVIAPDSFKDCLEAEDVAKYLAKGILRVDSTVSIKNIPMADGGEGFVQTMVAASGGEIVQLQANDALKRSIKAFYGILDDKKTAIIEMAAASGIEHLKKEERNPLTTSTYGTGELILDALQKGCKKIIIGIGGSATNDGGTGMAKALGYRFLNIKNEEIKEGGGYLNELVKIDTSNKTKLLEGVEILVACDVSNPLTGDNGASAIYGPQKGATPEMIAFLDSNLKILSDTIKKDLQKDILNLAGGGAAGGLGAGLSAFAGGKLKTGFDIVKEQTNLEYHIKNADVVFTGEGKIDGQTNQGKTPWGVAQIAQKHNKPIFAVAGVLGEGYRELYNEGFSSIFALPTGPASLETCLTNAPELLMDAGERIFRTLKFSR